jgi:serine protease Do
MKKSRLFAITALAAALLVFAVFSGPAEAGKKGKSWLGIYMQEIDKELAEAFDLTTENGVLVDDVVDDSPAEEAGIRRGDVIIEFDGNSVDNPEVLADAVSDRQPGDKVAVKVLRDGKEMSYDIELGKRSTREFVVQKYFDSPGMKWHGWSGDQDIDVFIHEDGAYLGVYTEELNDQLAEYFEVEAGVLVKQVEEDSPAEEAGFKAGDIIVTVNDDHVDTPSELFDVIRDHDEGDEVKVGIVRKGSEMMISATLDEAPESRSYGSQWPNILSIPKIPSIPGIKDDFKMIYLDDDEFEEDMDELREELQELREELKVIQEKLK